MIGIRDLKLIRGFAEIIINMPSSYNARECSILLHSIAKMKVTQTRLVQSIQNQFFQPEIIISLSPRELSVTLFALAKINAPVTTQNKISLIFLLERIMPLMSQQELVNTIW